MSALEINHGQRCGDSAANWFSPARFAVLLALFITALFPDVIFGARTFIFRDFGLYGYPVAYHFRESFWQGEVPLWNPLSNCGIPFVAEWSTLALYPPSLFYLLFPLSWSLGVFCLLHLFLGGMGMYWLAQRWTGDRLAAALAGVAFAFSGLMLSCLIWPNYMVSMSWMPLVLLTVRRAWEQGGRAVIWAALAGSMQMLGGPPEVVLATWGLLASLWLGQFIFERTFPVARILRFFAVVILITGICAPQIFPFLDFLAHSQRDHSFSLGEWSMPLTGWANFLVPIFFQERTSASVYLQSEQGIFSSYYMGIGVLLLAGAAAWWRRHWRCWWYALAGILCLTLALGEEGRVYVAVKTLIPQIGFMRYPIKLIIPLGMIFPMMAAWALAALRSSDAITQQRRIRASMLAVLMLIGIIGFLLWFSRAFPLNQEPWIDTAWNGASRALILLATAAILFLLMRAKENRHQVLMGLALIIMVWIDFATHTPSQNPTVEPSVYEPGLQPIVALKPKPAHGQSRLMLSYDSYKMMSERILTNAFEGFLCQRLAQHRNVNFFENAPKVDGFYSLYLRENQQIWSIIYLGTNKYRIPLADFMSVSQVTSPTNHFAFVARTNYMPMATAGQRPVFLDKTNTVFAMMQTNWNPRKIVFLRPEERGRVSVTNGSSARIIACNWTAHRILIDVQARERSLVVLSQTHYHPWQATVNGQAAPILRANHAFQAVQVPAGQSQVVLEYQDRLFQIGMIVSLISFLTCGIHGVCCRWPRC